MPQMDHANNVSAVFMHHLPFGDKDFLHWGRVLARTGDRLTLKWQTDKEPHDCNVADVYRDEKGARAATKRTVLVDVQPDVVKPRPMVNNGKEQFIDPEAHCVNMQYDQTMCSHIFACNPSRQKL